MAAQLLQDDRYWAEELARAAAPDEEPLAEALLESYLEGGSAQPGAPHGSFGAGEMLVLLPGVFKALALVAAPLQAVCSAENVIKLIEGGSAVFSAIELGQHVRKLLAGGHVSEAPQLEALARVCEVLPRELSASGMPADEAERASLRILHSLLADPKSASAFVKRLEKH